MASELARARAQITSARRRGEELESTVVRKAVISVTSAALGFGESKGMQLSYFGVPTKLGVATVGTVLELFVRDRTSRRFLGAVSDAALANYAYNASRTRAFIAGEEGGAL